MPWVPEVFSLSRAFVDRSAEDWRFLEFSPFCAQVKSLGDTNERLAFSHSKNGSLTNPTKNSLSNAAEAHVKAGFYPKAVFWLGIMVLTQISRSRFKQSRISPLIPHIYVPGCFVNVWRYSFFSKD